MPPRSLRPPFVGRRQELATLLGRLDLASQAEGSVVLITGEPGIGKTRLLHEVGDLASARGVLVLSGQAYEISGQPPYLPFSDALRDYVRRYGVAALTAQPDGDTARLTALVPELHRAPPDPAPAAGASDDYARYALFEAVAGCLCGIARAAPAGLLLVLEDLQWADTASLLLLQYLAQRLAGVPLLLAVSARTSALDRTQPLQETLAALARAAASERLRLAALGEEDAARLITGITGVAPAPAVATLLHRESAGNPFFLTELVRHLRRDGRDLADPDAVTARWGIPDSVRDVIARQLARLSPETNRLLQAAAVLGEGFSTAELVAMAGATPLSLLEGLDQALAAGLLFEEDDRYHFVHALVRQTLETTLRLPQRQQLHLRAAEALAQVHALHLDPCLGAVAGHYRLAGALTDPAVALAYARRAAAAAEAVFAWEAAADHLQAAVVLAEALAVADERQYCDLLLALGEMQRRAGDRQAARTTFRRASALARAWGDAERLARAALGYAGRWTDYEVEQDTRALLQEAARALAGADGALRAMVLARLAVVILNLSASLDERRTAEELGHEAAAIAERTGDRDARLYTLNVLHLLLWLPETGQRRLAIANEIVALAEAHGDRDLALEGRHWRLIDLLELGRRDAFDRELAAYDRLTEEFRQPFHRWAALATRATAALLDGRLAESERLAQEALQVGSDARGGLAAALYDQHMVQICVLQGRLDQALEWTQRLEVIGPLFYGPVLAGLYSQLGRTADAAGALAKVPEPGPPNAGAQLALACAVVGNRDRADRLYSLLEPYAALVMVGPFAAWCEGPVAHSLGLLATSLERWDAAAQHFEAAITLTERL
ncbi:MAG TPA: AAA family ATPase, partial [Dehalococcoidia bacterium]|nr:AAA family ATPase [Dehalococcoidia bacterium]